MRILHLIPSVAQGGAEAMLANLLAHAPPGQLHHAQTLIPSDNFFAIPAERIDFGHARRGRPSWAIIRDVRRAVRTFRPHIVHAWMYHANLATLAVAGKCRIVWSIHNDMLRKETSKPLTRAVNRADALLSHLLPDAIVYVSRSARRAHEAQGYNRRKGVVIANGIDLERFDPARFAPRPPANLEHRPIVITVASRCVPEKGHHVLIDVIARHPLRDRLRLRFIGQGCETDNELRRHVRAAGLEKATRFSGPVRDIERVYAETDILALSSVAEGLPMSVIEAAAMGCLICATNAGGVREMPLPTEFLFPPGDAAACAAALTRATHALRSGWDRQRQRARIAARYDIAHSASAYGALYAELMNARP